jgi:hypothetical protein
LRGLEEFQNDNDKSWLPTIFKVAWDLGSNLTPVATTGEVLNGYGPSIAQTIDRDSPLNFVLRVEIGDILDEDIDLRIRETLSAPSLSPYQCFVILDFGDADLTDVEVATAIIKSGIETIQSLGNWKRIVFQGTNYPEKNPARDDATAIVPRNEFRIWSKIWEDSDNYRQCLFGDFAADSAKFNFGSGGGGWVIRHFRYCTADRNWIVIGGKATDSYKYKAAMTSVSNRILASGKFAGKDFSSADDYIYQLAKGTGGPGNASTWREINVAHHVTQVVHDLGKLYGFNVNKVAVRESRTQKSLFD